MENEKEYFEAALSKKLLNSIPIYDCDICGKQSIYIQILEDGPDGRGGINVDILRLCEDHQKQYSKMYLERKMNASRAETH